MEKHKCIKGESNPRRVDGNDPGYHYPINAILRGGHKRQLVRHHGRLVCLFTDVGIRHGEADTFELSYQLGGWVETWKQLDLRVGGPGGPRHMSKNETQ